MNDSNPLNPIDEELLDNILFEKKKSRKTEKMTNDLPDGPKATPQGDDEEEDEMDAEDTMGEAAASFSKDSPMAKGSPMSTDGEDGDDDETEEEEVEEAGDWIQKAVNPKHKGYCTPMSKETCTPARKALAKRFKKAGRKEKKSGGTGWQGKV